MNIISTVYPPNVAIIINEFCKFLILTLDIYLSLINYV